MKIYKRLLEIKTLRWQDTLKWIMFHINNFVPVLLLWFALTPLWTDSIILTSGFAWKNAHLLLTTVILLGGRSTWCYLHHCCFLLCYPVYCFTLSSWYYFHFAYRQFRFRMIKYYCWNPRKLHKYYNYDILTNLSWHTTELSRQFHYSAILNYFTIMQIIVTVQIS